MTRPPVWLGQVIPSLLADLPDWFTRFAPPEDCRRHSAVLMLLGPSADEPGEVDIVLTERSHTLRSHAAQVSFPGGKLEPGEDAVAAALRETWEEVGVETETVEVIGTWPPLYLTPSSNAVTPVLAWWSAPHAIGVVDPGEVAAVARVPVRDLADPANRFTVTAPRGYRGPGFEVCDLFVWGFTAGLLDVLLTASGQDQAWDEGVTRSLPMRHLRPFLDARGRREE